MRFRSLGRRGPRVSVVGLGFWQAGSRMWGWRSSYDVKLVVSRALELGFNLFDTAELYGAGMSEYLLGEAFRSLEREVGRGEVVVASKVAGYRWRRNDIVSAVEKINKRLGFTVTLIQHHWPPPIYASICSVVAGLEEAVSRGLAEYYGFSNYDVPDLEQALSCSRKYEPISNQVQYSLAYRVVENRLKKFMEENGIGLVAWSPLAKGALAGLRTPQTKAQKGDRVFQVVSRDDELYRVLAEESNKLGLTRSQLALAWLVAKNAIPIPGLRGAKRVEEYARAGETTLPRETVEALDRASSKYVDSVWGREYSSPISRAIPGFFLAIVLKLMKGI